MEMKKLLMKIMIVISVVITVLLSAQQGQGCGSVPTPGGEGAARVLQEDSALNLHFQEGLGDFQGGLTCVPSRHGADPAEILVIQGTQMQGRELCEIQSVCGLSGKSVEEVGTENLLPKAGISELMVKSAFPLLALRHLVRCWSCSPAPNPTQSEGWMSPGRGNDLAVCFYCRASFPRP